MNNTNKCETNSKFGELEHPDPNCSRVRFMEFDKDNISSKIKSAQYQELCNDSGTKGVRSYILNDEPETKKIEPEVEILHPNTSENIRNFINAMPDGQKEDFIKSNSDDILRALLG